MSEELRAGAAVVDITPPAGLAMAGFVARTAPAEGAHDALTARAVVVGDTAIVCADVLGMDADTTARIRAGCPLPADNVVVAALHTHGGPRTLPGRLDDGVDPAFMARLEAACVEAVDRAHAARRPARLLAGRGTDPGIARNRRHADGITDPALPVVRIAGADGAPVATVLAYACHPVVLGADNRLWTADYPGVVRRELEARTGAPVLFLTGCPADANTGHSAHASVSLAADPARSFAAAERIGRRIAACADAAPPSPAGGPVAVASAVVPLAFARRETEPLPRLAEGWRREAVGAEPARRALLAAWIGWAEQDRPEDPAALRHPARVTALDWGGVEIVALPGEIFAETAHAIRRAVGNPDAVVIGYADDNPGYIPPAGEYRHGGYEIDEAHRFYGQPASFAPGAAEALAEAAVALVHDLRRRRS